MTTVSYSHASARIVLDATGVYTPSGLLISGEVVVNATNGEVRSVGVYSKRTRKALARFEPKDLKSDRLSFGSSRDRAILDAFVR